MRSIPSLNTEQVRLLAKRICKMGFLLSVMFCIRKTDVSGL
ncbi:hypothetical protein APHCRT_1519 [Anaplasma phagocytophilum str. CRT53-1]|uniref:Uncharacterized protein n=3 Tax=Anaplasma phagocytophilum TaxID=948 RepID=A0A0F3PK31_ANAPH|nr:hypothetical protein APHWEB_0625 [Anaplasma phagocytophilum str. Webster]KJV68524.1 hypothetical protein EPHNCH_0100 [Anaplasma phagocytophilum str. NCH-1]KJV80655.1 hypothetical protein APHCRT_1528 [Anaplasma phagocytophilum str. CRT53-1]KJV83219.1 hypothetical protein APHHGE2_0123 [Anaplasma phagocytophilum str. HGE2]KJV84504.1 hypothetical protein APHWI1_0891 [Anaplasma phagocytophilum str. ApWI1]KJV86504.1 hypothetical protein APHNYW_1435 [Anaplasma phagocytophilum str. ApNYW]KJV99702.